MSFYEALKDAASLAKKVDNIELYQKLLDLQAQALDIQSDNSEKQKRINELESEISRLKEVQKINAEDVVQDTNYPFFTLESEGNKIKYCSNCWRNNGKIVQFSSPNGVHRMCPMCNTSYLSRTR
ncbi:MAG: hypothetical protein JXQ82_07880 [Methanomicrobiaceae archaeon]|nr:hypothetical protein [Methanomicrobiaceae archaeon]